MKTTIFAVVFALIGINAAVAADNKNTNIIPTPNQLVETDLLPQFKAKVKMEAKGWGRDEINAGCWRSEQLSWPLRLQPGD